ncbi:C3H1-type domain-containing protein [Durusdinium trenchii]|uniref:C3H1-type domain-containing protein n=1 Tax=Durusdinium trenchii TaxID=1381693 RepID=A0ABP0MBM9_9DINO
MRKWQIQKLSIINLWELQGGNLDLVTTTWLGGKIQERKPIAFAMLWNYERHGTEHHAIAALVFGDSNRRIIMRTHVTGHWLPIIVQDLIQDRMVLKICASWTKVHSDKLAHCFGLEIRNFTVLASMAEARGIAAASLEALTDQFKLDQRKLLPQEGIDSSADWEAQELPRDQRQHVQEFPSLLYQLWEHLHVIPILEEQISTGIMAMKDGWEAQGIRRRHDGLYCDLCEAGPVGSTEQMESHVQGKKHQKKAKPPEPVEAKLSLSPELQQEGIVVSDFCSSNRFGLYFCSICSVGPFHDLTTVETHVGGRKHKEASKNTLSRSLGALARTSKPAAKTEDVKWPSAADLLRSAFEEAFPHFPRGRSEKTQEAGRGTEDGVSAAALLRSAFEEAFPNFPRRST